MPALVRTGVCPLHLICQHLLGLHAKNADSFQVCWVSAGGAQKSVALPGFPGDSYAPFSEINCFEQRGSKNQLPVTWRLTDYQILWQFDPGGGTSLFFNLSIPP